jgi:hypothetical protein
MPERDVLLMLEMPVGGEHYGETRFMHPAQKRSVFGAPPSYLGDGANGVAVQRRGIQHIRKLHGDLLIKQREQDSSEPPRPAPARRQPVRG